MNHSIFAPAAVADVTEPQLIEHEPSGAALDLLLFILQYKTDHDYSPTIREMQRGTGITSTSVVNYYRERLKRWGWLDFVPRSARTDHLTPKAKARYGRLSRELIFDTRDAWHAVLRRRRLKVQSVAARAR